MTYVVLAAIFIAISSPALSQYADYGPLLPAERSSAETSRYVAAEVYRDAYCAKWNDGCTLCQRNSANDQPACQPVVTNAGTCQWKPIQCEAVLKSIHRVCPSYTDGCNRCSNHGCTLMACPGKTTNYRCLSLRSRVFQRDDIRGHWRLTDPQARSCELILNGHVTLTENCISLGEPTTRLVKPIVADGQLRLLNANDEVLVLFDTSDPDKLTGIAPSQGWRLERLEPGTLAPLYWEGAWELRADNQVCQLFLSMRRQRLDKSIEVLKPHDVAFQSGCVSAAEPDKFRFSRSRRQAESVEGSRRTLFVIQEPLNIPIWTGWRHDVLSLVFHDTNGRETVFKPQDDRTWRAEIDIDGAPVVLRLRRKPE